MKHIMIDIETLGIKPTSKILSIGAVCFDEFDGFVRDNNVFYTTVEHIISQSDRTKDTSTLEWWDKQLANVRQEAFKGHRCIQDALLNLALWIEKHITPANLIWCKGVNFDFAILEHAYQQYGMPVPWNFRQLMDCRTAFNLFKGRVTVDHNKNKHNALADAMAQAIQLHQCLRLARGGI